MARSAALMPLSPVQQTTARAVPDMAMTAVVKVLDQSSVCRMRLDWGKALEITVRTRGLQHISL
jgi:hypothetical protein